MKSVREIYGKKIYAISAVIAVMMIIVLSGSRLNNGFHSDADGISARVTTPVDWDFEKIKNKGVLRMITRYNSNTYFLHQGMEVGFEYELLKDFATSHDMDLEVVIIGPDENPYDMLNAGEGDVIAANYTITPGRQQIIDFTQPYNMVNQVVVYSDNNLIRPRTLESLSGSGIPITVRRNSSYYARLRKLNSEGYDFTISVAEEDMDTESLLLQVANGVIQATVADNNIFNAANIYMDGLMEGPKLSENDMIAWAIRKNSSDLKTKMDEYLGTHFKFTEERVEPKRSEFLNILRRRYFEGSPQVAEYYNPEWYYSDNGLITPFDEMIKSVADSADIDWLILAAIIAQESRFNPNAESWAGAVGLMQILPRFSETEHLDLFIPETNIREGARILKTHLKHYDYLEEEEQLSFALATYNVGLGHMADARRLVIDQNKDPNKWEHVEQALLKLMQNRYNQETRYGFARGIETVSYVKQVMNRYQTYKRVAAVNEERIAANNSGIFGQFGQGTYTLP